MKKKEIIDSISSDTGGSLSESKIRQFLDALTRQIATAVARFGKVVIRGFGTFYLKKGKPRKIKDISTQKDRVVEPKPKIGFSPSKTLVESINLEKPAPSCIIPQRPEFPDPDIDAAHCETIWSQPNPDQRDGLRIRFAPADGVANAEDYPIVLMPRAGSPLQLPREGRSDVRGYKEEDFWQELQRASLGVEIARDRHVAVEASYRPYEPDFILYDPALNLYIDVEIDEPYEGFSRFPTHTTEGRDGTRNAFFTERGWIVVRFTERQVHTDPEGCCQLLRSLLASVRGGQEEAPSAPEHEPRWNIAQAQTWEKELYREKYLGIQSFSPQERHRKVLCDPGKEPRPKSGTKGAATARAAKRTAPPTDPGEVIFKEESHTYQPTGNDSGNADHVSVTMLIERFFPYFDEEAYIRKEMQKTGQSEAEIRRRLQEPSERGTEMHRQIELFLKGEKASPQAKDSKEFAMFRRFYEENIANSKLQFVGAEKAVHLPGHSIAGTIDALFQKPNGELVMIDWKRSKHLLVFDEDKAYPKKYGYGKGLTVLSHLDNSSYYKYELQQSFYKLILERCYGQKVSSMILVVLHPEYDNYYTIKLSDYREKEVIAMMRINEQTDK